MLERTVDGTGLVLVTFRMQDCFGASHACVVGEFNGWQPGADVMRREGNDFVADLHLRAGRTYRFRYLVDDAHWVNDWDADAYVPNSFGGEDGVIDLRDEAIAGHPPG